jgi:CelD/BcsL family acetyltransferase involved in cellulose biosynthesis
MAAEISSCDQALAIEVRRGGAEVIDRLAGEWRELAAKPFHGPDWCAAYLHAFAPQAQLLVLTARAGGRLCGVLCLVEDKTVFYGLPVTRLCSPSNNHFPCFDMTVDPAAGGLTVAREFWNQLKRIPGWHFLEFKDVPEGGHFQQLAQVAAQDGYRTGRWDSMVTPYVPLDNWKGDTDWWLEQRSPNFRGTLRRILRKIQAEGGLELHRIGKADPAALQRFYDLERAGWKGHQGDAINCSETTRRFYDEVAQAAATNGNLALYFLEWNDRVIAAHLGIEHGGRYFMLKTAYDESFRPYAPGHLIVKEVVNRCLRQGLREYDFTGPCEEWKTKWTSEGRRYAWVYVFNEGVKPRVAHMLKFLVAPQVKTFRRHALVTLKDMLPKRGLQFARAFPFMSRRVRDRRHISRPKRPANDPSRSANAEEL